MKVGLMVEHSAAPSAAMKVENLVDSLVVWTEQLRAD